MGGHRIKGPSDSGKLAEQPTEKKKGFTDWMNFIKPGNEEKDHWVSFLWRLLDFFYYTKMPIQVFYFAYFFFYIILFNELFTYIILVYQM